jgi:hypothetical protein
MHGLLHINIFLFSQINFTRSFLGTYNAVYSFSFAMPSEIKRFKFTVSWLCDDHIAADTFVVKKVLEFALLQPPLRAVEGQCISAVDVSLIAFRELVGGSRIGTAIGPRSR